MKKKTPPKSPPRKPAAKKKAKTPRKPRAAAKQAPPANPPPKPRRVVDKRGAFLAAYRVTASVKESARAVGMDRHIHYDWLKTDPEYHRRFREAQTQAASALEDEAVSRATRGVFEPNVFQGRFIYPQEEYTAVEAHGKDPEVRAWRDKPGSKPIGIYRKSDPLLMFLLRGFYPEKYKRPTAIEVTGPDGGPVEVVTRLQAARARVAALAAQQAADDDSRSN